MEGTNICVIGSYETKTHNHSDAQTLHTPYLYIAPGGGGTPLYGLYRYVRPQRVWFFSPFSHKLGIDFSHFAILHHFCTLVFNSFFFLEEATSSSRPPSPIHALPSSTPLNAYHAC